jgi:hypothetical protein
MPFDSYGVYGQRSYAYNNAGNPSPNSLASSGQDGAEQALTTWSGVAFTYQDPTHKHALTHISGVQK